MTDARAAGAVRGPDLATGSKETCGEGTRKPLTTESRDTNRFTRCDAAEGAWEEEQDVGASQLRTRSVLVTKDLNAPRPFSVPPMSAPRARPTQLQPESLRVLKSFGTQLRDRGLPTPRAGWTDLRGNLCCGSGHVHSPHNLDRAWFDGRDRFSSMTGQVQSMRRNITTAGG